VDDLLAAPITLSIGRALLHFVWQGTIVGLTIAVALRALAQSRATIRYGVASAGLLAMLLAPVATLMTEPDPAPAMSHRAAVYAAPPERDSILVDAGRSAPSLASPVAEPAASRVLHLAVLVWMAGVLLLSARLLAAAFAVTRLTRSTTPVDAALSVRVRDLARRLGVTRAIRVFESAAVKVPTVVGSLRPVILLPVSAITGLPAAHLDAVLVHELAHVRRHDYLVNLLQVAIETLLFYHPAVWWCSRQIRIEREHCCDDVVIDSGGDRVAYARALAMLEERRGAQPELALAATGGRLLDRIRRVLMVAPTVERRSPAWVVVMVLAVVFLAAISGPALWRGSPVLVSAAALESGSTPAEEPAEVAGQDAPAPPAAPVAVRPRAPAPPALPAPVAPQVPRTPVAPPASAPDVDWADYVRETQAALEILAEETGGIFAPAPPQPPLAPLPIERGAVPVPPAAPAAPALPAPAPAPPAAPALPSAAAPAPRPAPPVPGRPRAPRAPQAQPGPATPADAQIDRVRELADQLASTAQALTRQASQLRRVEQQLQLRRMELQAAEARMQNLRDRTLEQQAGLEAMQKALREAYARSEALRAIQPDVMKLREQIETLRKQMEALEQPGVF
jgi:beta-lactamase regulating signal transducer with metallopeptidase domain